MAKKRKTKKKVREACPICGHMKIKGSQCRSRQCLESRLMAPSDLRKWRILVAPAAIATCLAGSIKESKGVKHPKAVPYCDRVFRWQFEINKTVAEAMDAKKQFVNSQKIWLKNLVLSLFPPENGYSVTYMTEAITMLVQDSIEYLHECYDENSELTYFSKGELCRPWNFLEGALVALLKYFDPEAEGCEGSFEKYKVARSEIWGESLTPTKEPELRFYEAGERFLIAAHSKGDARDALYKEYGLVNINPEWRDPRCKIETETEGIETYADLRGIISPGQILPLRYEGD